ncbi:hypothetical protein D3C85_1270430 [compost metagenome]
MYVGQRGNEFLVELLIGRHPVIIVYFVQYGPVGNKCRILAFFPGYFIKFAQSHSPQLFFIFRVIYFGDNFFSKGGYLCPDTV